MTMKIVSSDKKSEEKEKVGEKEEEKEEKEMRILHSSSFEEEEHSEKEKNKIQEKRGTKEIFLPEGRLFHKKRANDENPYFCVTETIDFPLSSKPSSSVVEESTILSQDSSINRLLSRVETTILSQDSSINRLLSRIETKSPSITRQEPGKKTVKEFCERSPTHPFLLSLVSFTSLASASLTDAKGWKREKEFRKKKKEIHQSASILIVAIFYFLIVPPLISASLFASASPLVSSSPLVSASSVHLPSSSHQGWRPIDSISNQRLGEVLSLQRSGKVLSFHQSADQAQDSINIPSPKYPKDEEVQIVFSAHSTPTSLPIKSTLLSSSEIIQSEIAIKKSPLARWPIIDRSDIFQETTSSQNAHSSREVSSTIPVSSLESSGGNSSNHDSDHFEGHFFFGTGVHNAGRYSVQRIHKGNSSSSMLSAPGGGPLKWKSESTPDGETSERKSDSSPGVSTNEWKSTDGGKIGSLSTDGGKIESSSQREGLTRTRANRKEGDVTKKGGGAESGGRLTKKGVVIDAIALLLANNLELAKNKSKLISGSGQKNSTLSEESVRKINATLNFIRSLRDNVTVINREQQRDHQEKGSRYRLINESVPRNLTEGSFKDGDSSNVTQLGENPRQIFELEEADDLIASENTQSILTTTAKNIASWIRDSFFGSKLFRNRNTETKQETPSVHYLNPIGPVYPNSYLPPSGGHDPNRQSFPQSFGNSPGQMAPPGSPPLHLPGAPPPPYAPNHFIPNFIPPPEGFPSPYSPDSMMIPPEFLQDTGIDYWLNFIESAAHASAEKNPGTSEEDTHAHRPIKIGEKPSKGPNSIRDEIIDDDDPMYQRKNSGQNSGHFTEKPNSGKNFDRLPSSSPSEQSMSTNPIDTMTPRCDKFTPSICVDDFEYPEQAIVDEIYKRKDIFELMYSGDTGGQGSKGSMSASASGPGNDAHAPSSSSSSIPLVDGIPKEVEESYVYETYDDAHAHFGSQSSSSSLSPANSGYVCPSEVLHGKPKLARNIAGDWKVIVNAGEFTQTIRMEKCLKPNGACSFILPSMETRCAQVHSIHRLLVFEKGKGFFIDSFKIPTGCTCQVIKSGTGHSRFTPPSGYHVHSSDQTLKNHHSAHGHKGVHSSKGRPQNYGQSSSGHNIADTQAAFVSSYDTRFNIGPKYQTTTHTDGSTSSSNKYFSGSSPFLPSSYQEEQVQWFPPTSSFSPSAFPHSSGEEERRRLSSSTPNQWNEENGNKNRNNDRNGDSSKNGGKNRREQYTNNGQNNLIRFPTSESTESESSDVDGNVGYSPNTAVGTNVGNLRPQKNGNDNGHRPVIGDKEKVQLSNTLWSILMGGLDPMAPRPEQPFDTLRPVDTLRPQGLSPSMEESIANQLGLLEHIRSNYPHLTANVSPETVLKQLTDGASNSKNSFNPLNYQPPANYNNGHPLVQVIHVPVTATGPAPPVVKQGNEYHSLGQTPFGQNAFGQNSFGQNSFVQRNPYLGSGPAFDQNIPLSAYGTSSQIAVKGSAEEDDSMLSRMSDSRGAPGYLSSAKDVRYTPTEREKPNMNTNWMDISSEDGASNSKNDRNGASGENIQTEANQEASDENVQKDANGSKPSAPSRNRNLESLITNKSFNQTRDANIQTLTVNPSAPTQVAPSNVSSTLAPIQASPNDEEEEEEDEDADADDKK